MLAWFHHFFVCANAQQLNWLTCRACIIILQAGYFRIESTLPLIPCLICQIETMGRICFEFSHHLYGLLSLFYQMYSSLINCRTYSWLPNEFLSLKSHLNPDWRNYLQKHEFPNRKCFVHQSCIISVVSNVPSNLIYFNILHPLLIIIAYPRQPSATDKCTVHDNYTGC